MPQSPVATEIHQSLYASQDYSSEIALNLVPFVDDRADFLKLILADLGGFTVKVHPRLAKYGP